MTAGNKESIMKCSDREDGELRRGPWTHEEDALLASHVARHGEGRWNSLSQQAGLKRTGKSCRFRWLNYLKPDLKRGDLAPEEQLLILDLHSKWGNRWSKIARHLPGRTDNEIKNYWRTRVQKLAKHVNVDPNSNKFQDMFRFSWMPVMLQMVQQSSCSQSSASPRDHPTPQPEQFVSQQSSAQLPCPPPLSAAQEAYPSSRTSSAESTIKSQVHQSQEQLTITHMRVEDDDDDINADTRWMDRAFSESRYFSVDQPGNNTGMSKPPDEFGSSLVSMAENEWWGYDHEEDFWKMDDFWQLQDLAGSGILR